MRASFGPGSQPQSIHRSGATTVAQSAAVDVRGDLHVRPESKRLYSSPPAQRRSWRARLVADRSTRTWLQLGAGVLVQIVALVLIFGS
jgi:hypothetical protein